MLRKSTSYEVHKTLNVPFNRSASLLSSGQAVAKHPCDLHSTHGLSFEHWFRLNWCILALRKNILWQNSRRLQINSKLLQDIQCFHSFLVSFIYQYNPILKIRLPVVVNMRNKFELGLTEYVNADLIITFKRTFWINIKRWKVGQNYAWNMSS